MSKWSLLLFVKKDDFGRFKVGIGSLSLVVFALKLHENLSVVIQMVWKNTTPLHLSVSPYALYSNCHRIFLANDSNFRLLYTAHLSDRWCWYGLIDGRRSGLVRAVREAESPVGVVWTAAFKLLYPCQSFFFRVSMKNLQRFVCERKRSNLVFRLTDHPMLFNSRLFLQTNQT